MSGQDKLANIPDILNNVPLGVALVCPDGLIATANKNLLNIVGLEENLLDPGFNVFTYTPFVESGVADLLKKCLQSGENVIKEQFLLSPKDGYVFVRIQLVPLRDCDGNTCGIQFMLEDISQNKHSEDAIKQAYVELNLIFNTAADGMRVIDKDYNVRRINDTLCSLTGLKPKQVLGKKCYETFPGEKCHTAKCPLTQILKGKKRVDYEVMKIKSDGTKIPCLLAATPFRNINGDIIGIVENLRDITEQKDAEEISKRYHLLFQAAQEIILFTGLDGRIIEVNDAAWKAYGFTREELLGMEIHDLMALPVDAEIKKHDQEAFKGGITFESCHRRKDGSLFPVEVSSQGSVLDHEPVLMNIIRDITDRKEVEEKINHLAYFDPLTDLPNRTLFYDRLLLELKHASRNGQLMAVMFLDLDGFKDVNDTLGHAVGDQLLRDVGKRLIGSVRQSDTVARLGGDEFILLLPELQQVDDASAIAQKISQTIKKPWILNGRSFHISTSIGIALYPMDGENADTLMKHADIAMYRAKEKGDNYQFYEERI